MVEIIPPAGATVPPRETRQFRLPEIQDSKHGWGPSAVPEAFKDIPFAPFNKGDQLSRASDWQNTRNFRPRTQNFAGEGGFAYKHDEDDDSFALVDNTPKFKPKDGRRRYKKFSVSNRRRRGRGFNSFSHRNNGRGGKKQKEREQFRRRRWNNFYKDFQMEQKPNSVLVREDWEQVAEVTFKELVANSATVSKGHTLRECGELECFSRSVERASPRQPISLNRYSKVHFPNNSTSSDPVLKAMMEEPGPGVYATQSILAAIMAAPKSVQPWDIIVTKRRGKIIMDKRENSSIDRLTVNENWNEVIDADKDSINHPLNLSKEATTLNQYFTQQSISRGESQLKLEEENPFEDQVPPGMSLASGAFRYRSWTVAGLRVVARTELNAMAKKKNGKELNLIVRALNEFDPKHSGNVNWRQQLASQTGAVLATQMKNNANKLSRWTAELELSGADEIRLGFVSRSKAKDNNKHDVLMSQAFIPRSFNTSLQIRPSALWGSLELVIQQLSGLDDGRYVLIKDANNPKLCVFAVGEEEEILDGSTQLN